MRFLAAAIKINNDLDFHPSIEASLASTWRARAASLSTSALVLL